MSKKIVAFSAGKVNGNTETYIKIALEEAQKMGCEVELVRLNSCDLRPCKACSHMPCMEKGPQGCILKDGGAWLAEKFLECDGFLLGSPVWALGPAGVVSDFRDRIFGPKTDVAGHALYGEPEWMHGRTQHRPGSFAVRGRCFDGKLDIVRIADFIQCHIFCADQCSRPYECVCCGRSG